tara:strand:+ start:890 stop:1507 length:618 start_codon:yes stop_codon:yes gene_type:complete
MSWNDLPNELVIKILSYVQAESVFSLPLVCEQWRVHCKLMTIQNIDWRDHTTDAFGYDWDFGIFVNLLCSFKFISINLSKCWKVTDDEIIAIAEECTEVQELKLAFCEKVTDVGITKIAEKCPNLISLDLFRCERVTDGGIAKIGEGCSQLQKLILSGCNKVTDVGIAKIGEKCLQLQQLSFYECVKVTNVGVTKIVEGCHVWGP